MSGLDTLLRWSPLQAAAGLVHDDRPAVLAFHGVEDPENFATLMDFIVRTRHPLAIDDLDEALYRGHRLPRKSVLVTFDDGHRSILEHALPILVERSIPSVAFIVAGLVSTEKDFWWSETSNLVRAGGVAAGLEDLDERELVRHLKNVDNDRRLAIIDQLRQSAPTPAQPRRQLSWEELRTLVRSGVTIGNHTWSHPCLNRCNARTIRDEIERAHQAVSNIADEETRWFAYPNGDWDSAAESVLVELGYRIGFLFDHRPADVNLPPLRVSRLRVNSDTTADRFATILSGLHPAIHHARGRE